MALPARIEWRRVGWPVFLIAAALLLRLYVAPSYGYLGIDGDIIEQKQALHVALTEGVHRVYLANAENDPALTGGEWNGGYFINRPPLLLYLWYVPGLIYRHAAPEAFDLWPGDLNFFEASRTDLRERLAASRGFTVLLKLPGIVADTLIALALFAFLGRRSGPRLALIVAAAWAVHPGIVFNTAYWGQQDSVWVGLLLLALYWLSRGRLELSWIAYTLAVLTKPQAAAAAPLLLSLGVLSASYRRVAASALAALGAFVLVFLPFLAFGTFPETIHAIVRSTFGGEPFVSCNACNFWWLVTGGDGYGVSDATELLGLVSLRRLGLAAFLAANLLAFWKLRRPGAVTPERLFVAAAFVFMTFFTFATELHENHMMAVVPLVAMGLPVDRRLLILFALFSLTFLVNVTLFEPTAVHRLGLLFGGVRMPVRALTVGAALFNVAGFGFLARIFWRSA